MESGEETGYCADGILPLLLIIEDNSDMRRFIRAGIEMDFRVEEATNGEQGVARAIETIPDLIISDVMMPGMDGFEVCKQLKTDERTCHIPVILLTAKAGQEHKVEGLETGADEYLTKPFDAKELHVRIRNLIEQRRRLRDKFGRAGIFELKEMDITSADERFLSRAFKVAEERISDRNFTADDFAGEMCLSRMQLHRKLKELTNRSAWEFFRAIRLENAARLLRKQAGCIADIAHQSGYENPAHFTEAFRKHFGKTPSDFMNQD
jgi:DNA-binding response OmpR family regulator